MAEQEKDRLMDHEADGIQEYDNNLPRWWLYGFYFTIVFSCVYLFYYHGYSGSDWNFLGFTQKDQVAELNHEVAEAETAIAKAPKKPAAAMVLLTDPESIAKGKEIFNGTNNLCFTCHREDLGGMVGPNLTDEYWIHGCSVKEIVTSIVNGFPDKGMLPYGSSNRLSDEQLLQVVSFIISKQGSNPPDPKPIEEGRDVKCSTEPSTPAS